jgi:hypothetical protein
MKNDHSELLMHMENGIAKLTTSDAWRHHLAFQSRFHRYSATNVLLIAAQCPHATQVAGFRTWRRLQRVVGKGEKAIWIRAPMTVRRGDADDDSPVVRRFKYVAVFDVSQTHGEAPPVICSVLDGDDPDHLYERLLMAAQSLGFGVEDHEFSDSRHGDCLPAERRIRIEARNAPAQRVKTLAHELAHGLLHEKTENRALAELEAESTAYVVCRAMGLDTGGYSFGYVTSWAGGGEEAVDGIRSSCHRIQQAAARILAGVEKSDERAA